MMLISAPLSAAGKLDVSWNAPAGCPAYSDVESWLQAVVPPDARERLSELHVQVVISGSSSSGFSATVRVSRDGAQGEPVRSEPRTVEGPACEEVARSAIVVVSVGVSDVIKAEAAPPPAPPPSPPAVAPAPPPPTVAVEPATGTPARDRLEPARPPPARQIFSVAAGLGSGFAENPGVRVDAGALFALSRSVFVGPRLHALPSVTIRRDEELARFHAVAAGAELCGLPELSRLLHVGVCGRVEAGWAWSQGSRAEDPSDSGAVASVAASPTLSIGNTLRVLVQGDIELRLLRPRFEDDTGEVLAALPLVAASGLLGLSWAVP